MEAFPDGWTVAALVPSKDVEYVAQWRKKIFESIVELHNTRQYSMYISYGDKEDCKAAIEVICSELHERGFRVTHTSTKCREMYIVEWGDRLKIGLEEDPIPHGMYM